MKARMEGRDQKRLELWEKRHAVCPFGGLVWEAVHGVHLKVGPQVHVASNTLAKMAKKFQVHSAMARHCFRTRCSSRK